MASATPEERRNKRGLEHEVDVVCIRHARLARLDAAMRAWFIVQSFQSLLQKPPYPLVAMATAQANRGGSVGDRHPVSQE